MLTSRILKSGIPRNILKKSSNERPSRHSENNLEIPRFCPNIGLESFANQAPRLYNMLHDDLKSDNISKTQLKLKSFDWVKENVVLKP